MIYIVLNAPQILAATLAGLLIGLLWHRLIGGGGPVARVRLILTAALAEAWLAAILAGALILAPKEAGAWTMAIGSGVVIWAGFVLPVVAVTHLYRGGGWGVVARDCGHWLAVMVVQALLLQALGLTPPPA